MTEAEIRAEIRATFLSAEQMWGGRSPFQPNSAWTGYLATDEQIAHVDHVLRDFPATERTFLEPGNARYAEVWEFLFDILPAPGQELLQAEYDQGTIIVTPCRAGWTPSKCTEIVAIDPNTGKKYIYYSCDCGV